ncbi:MAG TPA: hypothetical protein VN428_14605, partial [Bryobacteraceae bacterium]|nr:hypothetical protein [Bryobacteraceae bacterium]
MASDSTRIVGKQVRVIFPDGLPRGLDPSQVQLVVRSPERPTDAGRERKGHGTVDAQQNRDGDGAAARHSATDTLTSENEPHLPPTSSLLPSAASAPPE